MKNYNGLIHPRIVKKLDKCKNQSFHCMVIPRRNRKFKVKHAYKSTITIDLANRTCMCRVWDLTRIPCHLACTTIYLSKLQLEDYVSDCFKKDTFLKAYSHALNLVPGLKYWPSTPYNQIQPFIIKK